MHTMWKGSISFGLVHIPIKIYSATEDKDVKLRYLHEKCHTPVKYQKMCPHCEEELEADEIVKGYEYEPGKFVEIKPEELKGLEAERRKTIDIIDFVQLEEIDPVFFNRSYFVGPAENGDRPFILLKKALEETGRIGVAKITIRSKEHLAVVRVFKHGLVMETVFYPDEVRAVEHVPDLPQEADVSDKELDMAKQLIDQLTTSFEPEKYTDNYRTALLDMIHGKVAADEGKAAPDAPRENVVDLMEALQASIEKTKPKKRRTAKKKEKATTT